MKRLIFLSLVAFLLASCAQEEIRMPEVSGGEVTTVRSLDDALKIADSFLVSLDDNTRSGSRTVESVEYLGGNAGTRSEDGAEQPMYYVVNYADEQGFAILSADARLTPVLAISPEGSVNLADTLTNPAFRAFINSLPKDEAGIRRIINPGDVTITFRINEVVKPLLRVVARKWNQTMFNDSVRCYNHGDVNTQVGGLPLATAQMLSRFEHPNYIVYEENGKEKVANINWDAIRGGYGKSDMCRLLKILGSKEFYNCDYTKGGTCHIPDSISFNEILTKLDYSRFDSRFSLYSVFNIHEINYFMENVRMPVIATGDFEYEDEYGSVSQIGYDWIIDGYAVGKSFPTASDPYEYTLYYYHMVWGNGQHGDGYYLYIPEHSEFHCDAAGYASDDNSGGNFGYWMENVGMFYNYMSHKTSHVP